MPILDDKARLETQSREWPANCHDGIEQTISEFRTRLPGWWYTLGECQVSCDASCAPTPRSPHMALRDIDDRFDTGFHADLPQPSTLEEALRHVMEAALEAIDDAARNAVR